MNYMTVSELIEKLQKLEPSARVVIASHGEETAEFDVSGYGNSGRAVIECHGLTNKADELEGELKALEKDYKTNFSLLEKIRLLVEEVA